MSELFYRQSDYRSFTPRKFARPTPIFTEYQNYLDTPEPSFAETFMGHLGYQWMPITNFVQEQLTFTNQDDDPEFRWQDQEETESYYQYVEELSRAKNREHYDFIKGTIDQGLKQRETMDRGGLFPALVAGFADPLNIAFALPVFNVGLKAAWAAGSALGVAKAGGKVGLGFGIASEAIRAPFDPLNTPHEVAMNIAASTVMTGLLTGGMKGIANTYSGMKLKKINEAIAKEKKGVKTTEPEVADPTTGQPEIKPEVKPKTKPTTKIKTLSELSDDEIQYRFGEEFNVKKIVTDPKLVEKYKIDVDKPNILGRHVYSDEGGTVYVDITRTKDKFRSLKEKAKNKEEGFAELERLRNTGLYSEASYYQSRFMFNNIDRFTDEDQFVDFVLFHEMMHGKYKQKPNQTLRAYEEEINTNALDRSQFERNKISQDTGAIKDTVYSRIGFVSKFIPSRIINEAKDLNVSIKNDYNKMSHNASVALEGNQYGRASQSLSARAKLYGGRVYALRTRMRERYMKHMKSREGTGEFIGFDVASMAVKANRYMRGDTSKKTFDEWFDDLIMTHIDNGNPDWHAANYQYLPEIIRASLDDLDGMLRAMDDLAREVGVLGDDVGIRQQIKDIAVDVEIRTQEITKIKETIKSIDDRAKERMSSSRSSTPQYTAKEKKFKDNLQGQLMVAEKRVADAALNTTWLRGVLASPTRKNYKFPIYYDKALLLSSPEKREELTEVFAKHFLEEETYKRWEVDKWVDVQIAGKAEKAREEAEKVVNKILEIGDNLHETGPIGPGKGKHLMIRATNIPEWKVKDFIIRDERVLENYMEKMGFRIEWARAFGKETIDEMLDRHDIIMKADGLSEKRRAEFRTNILADYEREAGQMIRSPDRWDNKYSRVTKKVAGMTYLTGAGVTSIIETVAMPIFEHGYGRVFRTAVQAVDGNWSNIKANVKNLMYVNEGMELAKPIAQRQFLTDTTKNLQPGKLERSVEMMEKGFYIGNGLSIITKIGKQVDMAVRIPKFFEQIQAIKNNSASAFDIEELSRYGISPDVARRLANMPWEKTETGMPVLNLANWPEATALDRELKRTMMTYLASASRNTIMHATAFDRPMIMDGFVYVKYKPWMRKLGIQVDERASIKVGNKITYPMARVESGVMAFPFQFYNFAFAATNRIAASMLDPARQHRMAGMSALLAMSYITLLIKKPDWWFKNRDAPELMMRSFEMSGITGVYSDIAYMALHSAIATGLHNPDDSWLKGKYKPTVGDQFADFAGATPGMMREWVLGAHELLTDQTPEGLKRLSYNLPIIGLTPFAEDMRELGRSITRQ